MTESNTGTSYISPRELVGHEIINRWVDKDGVRYTRVEFADGSTEEFEIPAVVAFAGALLADNAGAEL